MIAVSGLLPQHGEPTLVEQKKTLSLVNISSTVVCDLLPVAVSGVAGILSGVFVGVLAAEEAFIMFK